MAVSNREDQNVAPLKSWTGRNRQEKRETWLPAAATEDLEGGHIGATNYGWKARVKLNINIYKLIGPEFLAQL